MTAQEFRDALLALGLTQSSFARLLTRYGHAAKDPTRSVRRWASLDGSGPMSEAAVIVNLLVAARVNGIDLVGPPALDVGEVQEAA